MSHFKVGQLFAHPETNVLVVISGVKDEQVAYAGFDINSDGVYDEKNKFVGRSCAEIFNERFLMISVDDVRLMQDTHKKLLLASCPGGTYLTIGATKSEEDFE